MTALSGLATRLPRTRGGAHRRGRGRGQRLARGLLDARRFLSAAPPRDGARDLLERRLPGRRPRLDDRRTGRRPLERGLPARHGALRPGGLAGRLSAGRTPRSAARPLGALAARAGARRRRRGAHRLRGASLARIPARAARRGAALHALAPRARGRGRARDRAQPRGWRWRWPGSPSLLVRWTGNLPQWIALPVGIYAAVSWASTVGLRDRPCAALLFRTPTLRNVALGLSLLAFTGYGLGGWAPIYFRRVLGQPAGEVGIYVGLTAAAAGVLGVTLGGLLADRLRRSRPEGRLYVAIGAAGCLIPLAWWMLSTRDVRTAYLLNFPVSMFASMWIGVGASTLQDLVLPRMRAVASAFYLVLITFVGLALGPYCIGQLSDWLGDLGAAMRLALVVNLVVDGLRVAGPAHAPPRRVDAARAGARRRRARALIESARATHLLLSRRLSRWARRRLVGLARLGPRRALSAARPRGRGRRGRARGRPRRLRRHRAQQPGAARARASAPPRLIVLDHHVTARERFENDLGVQNALAGRGHMHPVRSLALGRGARLESLPSGRAGAGSAALRRGPGSLELEAAGVGGGERRDLLLPARLRDLGGAGGASDRRAGGRGRSHPARDPDRGGARAAIGAPGRWWARGARRR